MKFLLHFSLLVCMCLVNLNLHALTFITSHGTDIFFAQNDSRTLTQKDVEKLDDLVTKLTDRQIEKILVYGHSDMSERGQELLSKKRAETVKNKLIQFGITSEKIYTNGKSSFQPNSKSAKENRRVEIEATFRPLTQKSLNKAGQMPVKP